MAASTWWLPLAGFILTVGGILVGGTWKFATIREELREKLDAEIDRLREEVRQEFSSARREAGEMGAALREKITQVEFHMRDNFVGKRTFETVVDELRRGLTSLGEKLDRSADKIDEKLERLLTRAGGAPHN